MTAEVAILNREAVALASDSAVTLEGGVGQKIYTSANKIFQLSRTKPVGVMLYDSSTLNDVSWETIIKVYRDQLGTRGFPTLDGYVEDFTNFLDAQRARFFDSTMQDSVFERSVHAFLHLIREDIDDQVEERVQEAGSITAAEIETIVRDTIADNHKRVMAGPRALDVPVGQINVLRSRYGKVITENIGQVLSGHVLDALSRRRLRQLLLNLFVRVPPGLQSPIESGIIFAGFGDEDLYPRLREYMFEVVVGDYIKRYPGESVTIDPAAVRARVVPFAQREMVIRFMEGVDPQYQLIVENAIQNVLLGYPDVLLAGLPGVSAKQRAALLRRAAKATPATMHTIRDLFAQVREEAFWGPVAQLVDLLPKEEIAAMAESLVNLTSFKRRISWDAETVGGPVDVAVISRGDGFIWIKRKHYFQPELNPGFIINRYGGTR